MNEEAELSLEEPEDIKQEVSATKSMKPSKPKKYDLVYDGKTGSIYKIVLLDLLLRIITLNIYSFWGKTRFRKYVVSHHSLGGDRFEYTGTGGELFKGFLKVLPILVILFAPLAFLEAYPVLAIFYIPLIYCYGIAVYGATRYRYSRSRWRGIRGYLDGSTTGYANLAFGRMLLNIVTLGFAIPASDIAKHKYIMNNSYFGNVKAEFNGDSKVLFGAYMKSIFLIFLLMILFLGGIFLSIGASLTMGKTTAIIGIAVGFIGVTLIFPIARSIYTAALMREKMRGLKIGNLKFMNTVGAMDLIKHKLANLFIMLFTLGFGIPYILQRNIKFNARYNIIMGDLDAFQAEQGKDQGLSSGEGLEAGFDIDAGFF